MNSTTWGFAVSSIASLAVSLTAGLAAAQPPPGQPAPGGPPPPPMAEPAPPPPGAAPMRPEPADTGRPTDLSIAIGIGYAFPTSLQTPNITSVRVRLARGLTFEPQLVVANTSDKVDTGGTTTNKQTELAIATVARYPLRVHRKVDLELLGNAGISTRLINPSGANNDRTITTLDVGYGIGLGYWFTPHWNLSLSASNPLLTYARTRQEMTADNVTVTSSTTIGVVFDPEVTLMIHLFD